MSEKLNLANPMAYQEVGDVGTYGSGIVSEAVPVDKDQKFDTVDDVKEKRIARFQDYAKKTLAILENAA